MTNQAKNSDRLNAEDLATQINKLCQRSGFRQTIVAVSRSGVHLPMADVMVDGFSVALILTKAEDNDPVD